MIFDEFTFTASIVIVAFCVFESNSKYCNIANVACKCPNGVCVLVNCSLIDDYGVCDISVRLTITKLSDERC